MSVVRGKAEAHWASQPTKDSCQASQQEPNAGGAHWGEILPEQEFFLFYKRLSFHKMIQESKQPVCKILFLAFVKLFLDTYNR